MTAVFGLLFGLPSLRLKGLYLAIATLAAHFITTLCDYSLGAHDRRRTGASGPASYVPVLGLALDSDARIFYSSLPS